MVKNNLKLVKLFLFCFICTLGMTIFIDKSAVYADGGNLIVISSDKQQLKKGDILTYSIDMPTNEDVMAAMLTIKYDDAKLEPLYAQSDIGKSIQPGSVLNSSTSDYNIDSDGNIKIVMVSNSDKIAIGNICTMSFKVKPNTTGNIDINVEKCETCNNEVLSNSTTVLNKASVLIQTEKTETSEDKISLDKTATSIETGKTGVIKIIGDIKDKDIKWSSSDESIATVDNNGKITAKKTGEVVVKAIVEGKEISCKVTVIAESDDKTPPKTSQVQNPSKQIEIVPINNSNDPIHNDKVDKTGKETISKAATPVKTASEKKQTSKTKAAKTSDNNNYILWMIIIVETTLLLAKTIKNSKTRRAVGMIIAATMILTCAVQSSVYAKTNQNETMGTDTEQKIATAPQIYDSIPSQTINALKNEGANQRFQSSNACWYIAGSDIKNESMNDFSLELNQEKVDENDTFYSMLRGRFAEKLRFAENRAWNFEAGIEINSLAQTNSVKSVFIKANDLTYKQSSYRGASMQYSYRTSNGEDVYVVDGVNGDCNGDNIVDTNDVSEIMQYLDGKKTLNSVDYGFVDVDYNNEVNLKDLVRETKFADGRNKELFNYSAIIGSTSTGNTTGDNTSDGNSSNSDTNSGSSDYNGGGSSYDGGGAGKGGSIASDYASGGGKNPSSSTGIAGKSVVEYAMQFVGNPYVWGGNSLTNGVDCSGFVHEVYAHFGISTPRYSQAFKSVGQAVSLDNIQPGDVVVYPGHVAIYAGDGIIVEAQSTKAGITANRSVQCHTILAIRRLV